MKPHPIILHFDRPISWPDYCREQEEGQALARQVCRENKVDLDPEIFTEMNLAQNEIVLECAAASLGIPLTAVYRTANAGRIEWLRPSEHDGSFPIFARLDGGEWTRQPALKGFDAFSPADAAQMQMRLFPTEGKAA